MFPTNHHMNPRYRTNRKPRHHGGAPHHYPGQRGAGGFAGLAHAFAQPILPGSAP